MTSPKSEFWWASIHGADPEPVEKTEYNSRPCIYTLGCADPFYLDDPGIRLIGTEAGWSNNTPKFVDHLIKPATIIQRLKHPDIEEAERAALQADRDAEYIAYQKGLKTYVKTIGKRVPVSLPHGWRGPR